MGLSRERLRDLKTRIEASLARPVPVQGLKIVQRGATPPFEAFDTLTVGDPLTNPYTLLLEHGPVAFAFAQALATGSARELACFGPRGDRKTSAAFVAMLWHAVLHARAGFLLPVSWMSVRDSHASHRLTTVRTLQHPWWGGVWRIEKDEHVAVARLNGRDLVHVDLIGVEDRGATDRLRMETVGLHFDEVAPVSVMLQSSGISEEAWGIALTSQRLPSHCHPAAITTNLPDEDHWSWQRFVAHPRPGTACFRIPPGESASAEQREEWARALEGRPDLLARLLAGEPGAVLLGPQVATGYRAEAHVAPAPLEIDAHAPLWMGWDAGYTPTTVVGQRVNWQLRVYAGLVTEKAGTRQHVEQTVLPWLSQRAPWTLRRGGDMHLFHRYDPSMDTGEQDDIDASPLRRIRESLGGDFEPGAVSWPGRRDPMLAAFNMADAGRVGLQIDPGADTELLRKALAGRWYYRQSPTGEIVRDLPHKPNHPWEDLGDAFCYLIGGVAPVREVMTAAEVKVETAIPDLMPGAPILGWR